MENQELADDAIQLVITTFPDRAVAAEIGEALVEARLAACINLVPGVESIYQWEGEICHDKEVLGLLKTTRRRVAEIESILLEKHPYDQPELIILPISGGNEGYLEWVRKIDSK